MKLNYEDKVQIYDLRQKGSSWSSLSKQFRVAESSKIIRLAKADLVSEGYDYYRGRKVGRVPLRSVEKILGYGLTDIYKNVKIDDVQTGKIVEAKLKFKEAL